MADTNTREPSWKKWANFEGPTLTEEREAFKLDQVKGRAFRRDSRTLRNCIHTADAGAGQWGGSRHKFGKHY